MTWWSLTHAKPVPAPQPAAGFEVMPSADLGGSPRGRAALEVAIGELRAGAGEVGGNNNGPFVKKYLKGTPEGNAWCAAFVSWCFDQPRGSVPFEYTVKARDLLAEGQAKGWAQAPGSGYRPVPGDIVVWWRVRADGWQGHAGLVHHTGEDWYLYTIEGNKSPNVAGFAYVLSRMEQLLGYVHVPGDLPVA